MSKEQKLAQLYEKTALEMDKDRGSDGSGWLFQWLKITRIEYYEKAVKESKICIVEGCSNRKEKSVVLCGYHWEAYISWSKTQHQKELDELSKHLNLHLLGENRT